MNTNPTPKTAQKKKGAPKKSRATDATNKKKRLFIENFFKQTGNVNALCKAVGIHRATYYRWLNSDKKFEEAIEAEQEALLDFAESKLLNLINDKNPTAIIFYLKTKGKKRGYIEKQEIEHHGNKKKPIRLIFENTPPNGKPYDNGAEEKGAAASGEESEASEGNDTGGNGNEL